jgi:hypothetical protein
MTQALYAHMNNKKKIKKLLLATVPLLPLKTLLMSEILASGVCQSLLLSLELLLLLVTSLLESPLTRSLGSCLSGSHVFW